MCGADISVDDVGFIDKVIEDMPRRLGTVRKGQVSHAATVHFHHTYSACKAAETHSSFVVELDSE
jgi:hypothetical protein